MTDRTQFTVVFEGDLSKLPFNPMAKHDTPFGRVIGCGFGNAFDELEEIIDSLPKKPVPVTKRRKGTA